MVTALQFSCVLIPVRPLLLHVSCRIASVGVLKIEVNF